MRRARFTRQLVLSLFAGLAAALAGCPDEGLRQIGASCYADGQCASGLCASSVCLDPALDDDGDSLINLIEAGLGTDALSADSDGDQLSDPVEIGQLESPLDSDGDGRIDAIESAARDADGDCVMDQVDPRDNLSDQPSEELPDACGDGGIRCVANPLAGTCAARLGEMVAGCFGASGACVVEYTSYDEVAATVTWDSGAHITWKTTGETTTGQLVGAAGTLCGTFRETESNDATVTVQVTAGPTFTVRDGDQGSLEVSCPNGGSVTIRDSDQAALAQCSGLNAEAHCTTSYGASCEHDQDCASGGRCCPIPYYPGSSGTRACLPVEVCPEVRY